MRRANAVQSGGVAARYGVARADDYCSPELAALLHDRSPGPKQLVWLDATCHIDLYDVDPWVGLAVDAVVAHLRRYL